MYSYSKHNHYMGNGGGSSGCGAKMVDRGGVVWLSSLRTVAMMDLPANDRPAKVFIASDALFPSKYFTYTRPTPAASSARSASCAAWCPASPHLDLSLFMGRGIRRSSTSPYLEHSSFTSSYMSPYSWSSKRSSEVTMFSMRRMRALRLSGSAPAGIMGLGISGNWSYGRLGIMPGVPGLAPTEARCTTKYRSPSSI